MQSTRVRIKLPDDKDDIRYRALNVLTKEVVESSDLLGILGHMAEDFDRDLGNWRVWSFKVASTPTLPPWPERAS